MSFKSHPHCRPHPEFRCFRCVPFDLSTLTSFPEPTAEKHPRSMRLSHSGDASVLAMMCLHQTCSVISWLKSSCIFFFFCHFTCEIFGAHIVFRYFTWNIQGHTRKIEFQMCFFHKGHQSSMQFLVNCIWDVFFMSKSHYHPQPR